MKTFLLLNHLVCRGRHDMTYTTSDHAVTYPPNFDIKLSVIITPSPHDLGAFIFDHLPKLDCVSFGTKFPHSANDESHSCSKNERAKHIKSYTDRIDDIKKDQSSVCFLHRPNPCGFASSTTTSLFKQYLYS